MSSNIYDDFKDIAPYNQVVDDDWVWLWSYLQTDKHPIAYLIIHRFSDRYCGEQLKSNYERFIEKYKM